MTSFALGNLVLSALIMGVARMMLPMPKNFKSNMFFMPSGFIG